MSIRTIIEINHDRIWELQEKPQLLEEFLRRLVFENEKQLRASPVRGIRVLAQRHHSETLELTVE